jgi:hypothetical protein
MRTSLDRNETLVVVTAGAGFSLTPRALGPGTVGPLTPTATGKSKLKGIEQPISA